MRTVVTSAATEAGLNLVIEPPSDKRILFVSVGVSEKEVKDRMMKLKVRAKAVVDALLAASKNTQLAPPKPLCSFLARISSDGVYYPGAREVNGVLQSKFLWPEEESVRFFTSTYTIFLFFSSPHSARAGVAHERRRAADWHPAASERTHDIEHHVRALFSIVHRAATMGPQHRPPLRPNKTVHRKFQAHCIAAAPRLQPGLVISHWHSSGTVTSRDCC